MEEESKDKLRCLRITELKSVLHQLGLPKHGKKQDLIDRILSLLSADTDAALKLKGLCNKLSTDKEAVTGLINETYRNFKVTSCSGSTSRSRCDLNTTGGVVTQSDVKVRCLCGSSLITDCMIKCEDPQCNVLQHVNCVVIPDKIEEGSPLEIPTSFYCEICRLNRADPFWYSFSHPLFPVKIVHSNVATDGTILVQCVEKAFSLSKSDKDVLRKAEYDLQVWCILLNDKTLFRLQWPLKAELRVNDNQIRLINRQTTQQLGANGRDDGPLISVYTHVGVNKVFFSRADSRAFCLGIRIAKRRTVQQVLSLVPKESDGESFYDALTRVRRCLGGGIEANDADSDSDVKVVADSVAVNLRCPMSGSRIKIAGRFKPCVHIGCFDLECYLELNQRSRKWQCPICLKNYCLESMIIDAYFNRITSLMLNCGDDVAEIDVKPDGAWRARKGLPDDLTKWHLPDINFTVLAEDQKPTPGVTRLIKQEVSPDELAPLKIGIRKTVDGQWEINMPERKKLSSGDGFSRHHADSCQKILELKGEQLDEHSVGQCEQDSAIDNFDMSAASDASDVIVLSDSDDVIIVEPPGSAELSTGTASASHYDVQGAHKEDTGLQMSDSVCLDFLDVPGNIDYEFWNLGEQMMLSLENDSQATHEPVKGQIPENGQPLDDRYSGSDFVEVVHRHFEIPNNGPRLDDFLPHRTNERKSIALEGSITEVSGSNYSDMRLVGRSHQHPLPPKRMLMDEQASDAVQRSIDGQTVNELSSSQGLYGPFSHSRHLRSVRQKTILSVESDSD